MKTLYIIPGWQETTRGRHYQLLRKAAEEKGYEVVCKNIDWKKPLSEQIFAIPPGAVLFGFSLGAILAWLVAQKYPIEHLILASMTPQYSFTQQNIKKSLIDLAGQGFVEDIVTNLKHEHLAKKQTAMYGDLEGEQADILVLDTDHELNRAYVEAVIQIL